MTDNTNNLNDAAFPIFELEHIGITTTNDEEAHRVAAQLCALFGLRQREGKKSVYAGSYFEVLRRPYRGRLGHIAMRTENLDATVRLLESKGVRFDYDTADYGPEGELLNIYLADEIAGFAFHIVERPLRMTHSENE